MPTSIFRPSQPTANLPVITIDGPAASGKTSVSRELARRLGWSWVSTGIFYRTVGWMAQQKGLDLSDAPSIEALARYSGWRVAMDVEMTRAFVDDREVTSELQVESVGSAASKISQHPAVRAVLLGAQRDCARPPVVGLVAEGRDCGTIVFPQAFLKVFLTANEVRRAERRALEEGLDLEVTYGGQRLRDAQDRNRKVAPMVVAADGVTVDTSELHLDEVIDQLELLVRSR